MSHWHSIVRRVKGSLSSGPSYRSISPHETFHEFSSSFLSSALTNAPQNISVPSFAIFEVQCNDDDHHSKQCSVIVHIEKGTITFNLEQFGSSSTFELDCGSVQFIRKSQSNLKRVYFCEKDSACNFHIDFLVKRNVDDFLCCLYGARRYKEVFQNIQSDCLSIFIGTWNMGCIKPMDNMTQWLLCQGSGVCLIPNVGHHVPHDMYIIGIQEDCQDQQWDSLIQTQLKASFNQDFQLVCTKVNAFPKTLKLSLFCQSNLKKYVKNLNIDAINTGFANKCGNKGAVSISFSYHDASFCIINSHLVSGAENAKKREEEFRIILQKLDLNRDKDAHADLLQRFDFVFCLGDFNMRTDAHVTEAMRLLQNHKSHVLLKCDELHKFHMAKNQNPFRAFKEPPIFHGPTYRYLKGTRDNLDPFKKKIGKADKINVPAWCDRVLYKTRNERSIYPLAYGIQMDVKTSDHKPVFSSFLLALPTREYLAAKPPKSMTNLHIEEILLKIDQQWKTRINFYMQMKGTLLTEPYLSKYQNLIVESPEFKVYVVGRSKLKDSLKSMDLHNKIAVLFLKPFKSISMKEGLSERDIDTNYLSVKILVSDSKTECLAETVIPLKLFPKSPAQSFEISLFEHGIKVGSMILRGSINHQVANGGKDKVSSAPRLIDFFFPSLSHEDSNQISKSLFDFVNERFMHDCETKPLSVLKSNSEQDHLQKIPYNSEFNIPDPNILDPHIIFETCLDSNLTNIQYESPPATKIRSGASHERRVLDSRVDLSTLEAALNEMQSSFPPTQSRLSTTLPKVEDSLSQTEVLLRNADFYKKNEVYDRIHPSLVREDDDQRKDNVIQPSVTPGSKTVVQDSWTRWFNLDGSVDDPFS